MLRMMGFTLACVIGFECCDRGLGKADRSMVDSNSPSSDLADCRTIQHEMGETEVCGVHKPDLMNLPLLSAVVANQVGNCDQPRPLARLCRHLTNTDELLHRSPLSP